MKSEEQLTDLLSSFQSDETVKPAGLLAEYLRLLRKWNERVNLTASTEWRDLRPLFQEAIWAADLYPTSHRSHLDIGSGAGFPALLMKILRPRMHLEMVESRTKRAVFLETVVHELGLQNVQVHNRRLESFLCERRQAPVWSVVSWKAVRLNWRQVSLLRQHSSSLTEFWIFHGEELPVEEPERALDGLSLVGKSRFPSVSKRYLSIYRCHS